MDTISSWVSEPWLLIGDFNSVLSLEDKQGGNAIIAYEIADFLSFIQVNAIEDMSSLECKYIWTNGHMCSKLDRVMMNKPW